MRKRFLIPVLMLLLGGATVAATAVLNPVFLGAPAGTPVHYQYVQLPKVKVTPGSRPAPHASAFMSDANPFAPDLNKILNGEVVVTTEAQMKYIWDRVFEGGYDPALFNFNDSFVVLMGGGSNWWGGFSISSVERVEATYPAFGFTWPPGGTDVDPFLSVTSTMYFPGIMPKTPPPDEFRVVGIRISKDLLDDVVFHRMFVFGV